MTLSYPNAIKHSLGGTQNTTIKTLVNIVCDKSMNGLKDVSIVSETQINTYTFTINSPAGCSFEGDTQIWQYLSSKSIIFAIVFWVVGLYSMFLGYFLIRVTIMIYGFITAAGFSLIFFTFGYPE